MTNKKNQSSQKNKSIYIYGYCIGSNKQRKIEKSLEPNRNKEHLLLWHYAFNRIIGENINQYKLYILHLYYMISKRSL